MLRFLLYILTLQCTLAVAAIAQKNPSSNFDQETSQTRPNCGNLTTIEQCLAQYHVALTKDGLLAALHSQNKEISSLAAAVLADKGIKEAIPDLTALLEAKSEPLERIGLAYDLAQLGDERGVQTLQHYSDDPSVSMGNRLNVAMYLLRYQPRCCARTLIEGLQDDVFRVQALGMIWFFKELSPSDSAQARALLLGSLSDKDFEVRLQAAQTIEGLVDASAIPALEAAIANEPNSFVQSAMKYALEALQEKQHETASDPAS